MTDTSASGAQPRPTRHAQRARRRRRTLLIVGVTLGVIVLLLSGLAAGAYLYVSREFHDIKSVVLPSLTHHDEASGAFNVLVVGSDSRADLPPSQIKDFGSTADVAGQRSDVIMIVHVDPATHRASVLSIPRDTFVQVAGTDTSNRINTAFAHGPDQLVRTIQQNFHIPINHFILVDFSGFQDMVNALNGIYLDFPYPAMDTYSGLHIHHAGCQRISGFQALAVARSRHYQYFKDGVWQYDGLSDFSRIKRQDAFLRAVIKRAGSEGLTNPIAGAHFLSAAVRNLTKDDTLSLGNVLEIARDFRSFGSGDLQTFTLPTYPVNNYQSYGDVLFPAPGGLVQHVVDEWLHGPPAKKAPSHTAPATTTPSTTVAPSTVAVAVENGAGTQGLAGQAATDLRSAGFRVVSVGNAPSFTHTQSVVQYTAGNLAQAQALQAAVQPAASLAEVASLPGGANVALVLGSQFTGVHVAGTPTSTVAPTTTAPLNPDDAAAEQILHEQQAETFNPTPC